MEKNKTIGLWYGGMAVLSLLFFAFLAMPFAIDEVSFSGISQKMNFNGYDLINFQDEAGVSIVIVFLIVGAVLLALTAVIHALCRFEVIKNKDVEHISKIASNFLCVVMFVLSVVNIGLVSSYVSQQEELAKKMYASYIEMGADVHIHTGWFGLISLFVLAIGNLVCYSYAKKLEESGPTSATPTSQQSVSDAPKAEENSVSNEKTETKVDSGTKKEG